MEKVLEYWYLVPTVMAIASIIVNATPNETDNKWFQMANKILNTIAANFNVKGNLNK